MAGLGRITVEMNWITLELNGPKEEIKKGLVCRIAWNSVHLYVRVYLGAVRREGQGLGGS